MCLKEKKSTEIDPTLELKYGIKLSDLRDLMQFKSNEATEKIHKDYDGVKGLAQKLNSDLINGLDDSDIEQRKIVFGRNEIPPKPPKLFIQLAFEAVQDTTLIILLVCAVISIGLSFYHPTAEFNEISPTVDEANLEWIEGVAILFAVCVVVLVTAFNDWRKERQFRGLQEQIEKDTIATVIRNSQVIQINVKDIVVGDVCCVKYGDLLQADGVVIQSSDLKIDESALTGETDLIKKNESKNAILLSGTHVMEGSGKYLVTAVGLNSQNGIIFALLGAAKEDDTQKKDENGEKKKKPHAEKHRSVLQAKLTKLAVQIGYFGMSAAVFTFIVLCIRLAIDEFAVKKSTWSNAYIKYFLDFLIQGITVLVVAIPEGLPLAVTLSLAYAVRKMTKDNNLVRHLDACETMGSATTICSDKTGTLTTNRMTAVQCFIGGDLHKTIPQKEQISSSIRDTAIEAISINSNYTSKLEAPKQPGELPKQLGNKTECGLLGFVEKLGGNYETVRSANPIENFEKVYTFNSARKMMTTIIKKDTGYRLLTKGASEMVLSKCSYILNKEGKPEPISPSDIDGIIKNVVETMACDGLRTMCVAYRDFRPKSEMSDNNPSFQYYSDTPDWEDEPNIVTKLTCICLVGIEDPVRPEVPPAIKKCQTSGVVVRMVTGDNINTATSIATKCGIIKPGDNFLILESKEFNSRIRDASGEVSQKLLDEVWPRLRVLARSSPQDKYILVNGIVESKLSANREVVAVTGDGTNDGPALKRADVGFAMGIQGTDVAKEASDIILTDDNFSSIVKAMMWGRNVYDSISKFLQFQLTANLTATILSIICAATIRSVPLKAVPMLWVNLVMDTLGSLALATEPPTEKLLERKPYGREKHMLTPTLLKNIVGHSVYQLIVLFILVWDIEDWMMVDSVVKYNDLNKLKLPSQHFTIIFNTFVLMTLFNEINARKIDGERNVFEHIHKNPYFYVIWLICFIGQILIVNFGSIAFSVTPLELDQWVWCLFLGIGELLWAQLLNCIPSVWVERLFSFCKLKRNTKVTNMGTTNGHNGTTNGNHADQKEASTSSDLDKQSASRVLWLRGIGRIHNQLEVVNNFQTRLDEVAHRRSLYNNSLASFKEIK